MITTKSNTNEVYIAGKVATQPQKSHQVEGSWFYEFNVKIERLSDNHDLIPVIISERAFQANPVKLGDQVHYKGEFRSLNKQGDTKNKLVLYTFVKEVLKEEDVKNLPNVQDAQNINIIKITGFICKKPIYRVTPFKREICDVIIAVNRPNKKSDYIPCIFWGRDAGYIASKNVGTKLELEGRIQSREYQKKSENGDIQTKTAYEVSCKHVRVLEQELEIENQELEAQAQ